MKLFIMALLFLVGCEGDGLPKNENYVVVGYVRNVWCTNACYVTFETEEGKLIELPFENQPPLWAGLRCQINYHNNAWSHGTFHLDYVERKK